MSLFIIGFCAGLCAMLCVSAACSLWMSRRWSAEYYIEVQLAHRRFMRRLPPPLKEEATK